MLFVEMKIPGKSGYYCIEIGKVQAIQKSTNVSLSDDLMSSGCLSAAMLTASRYSNI